MHYLTMYNIVAWKWSSHSSCAPGDMYRYMDMSFPPAVPVPTEFFYRIAEFHANDFKKLVKCYLKFMKIYTFLFPESSV